MEPDGRTKVKSHSISCLVTKNNFLPSVFAGRSIKVRQTGEQISIPSGALLQVLTEKEKKEPSWNNIH